MSKNKLHLDLPKQPADYEFDFHMYDHGKCKSIPCTMRVINGMLAIYVQGYGEYAASPGNGSPILIEHSEGNLKVHLWSDINQKDPTHSVDMSRAKEENYQEDHNKAMESQDDA